MVAFDRHNGRSVRRSLVQDPTCLACERADNNFDVRHTVNASLLYTLPFGTGRRHLKSGALAQVAGGWSLGGIWNARTGLPLNVTINRPDEMWQDKLTGEYLGGEEEDLETARPVVNVPGGGEGRPALGPIWSRAWILTFTVASWFGSNAAAFAAPLPGTFGSLGRNALRGPGFSQIDLQVSRTFKLAENHSVMFRAEAFNLLNHSNFSNPIAVLPDELGETAPGQPYSQVDAGGLAQSHRLSAAPLGSAPRGSCSSACAIAFESFCTAACLSSRDDMAAAPPGRVPTSFRSQTSWVPHLAAIRSRLVR